MRHPFALLTILSFLRDLQYAVLDPGLRVLAFYEDKQASHSHSIVDLSVSQLVSGGRERDASGVFIYSFMLRCSSRTVLVAAEDESVILEWHASIHYLRRLCLSHVSPQYFAAYDDQHPVGTSATHSKVLHFIKQQSLPQYEASFNRDLPQTPTVQRQALAQYLYEYNFVMEVEHPRGKPPQWRLIDLQYKYATRIQSLWRAKQARRRVWGEGGINDQNDCAIKIQCRMREKTARQERGRRQETREASLRERALACIKKRLTNFVQRRRERQALVSAIHETRERHDAATTIQKGMRHRLARNELRRLRKAHLEAVWNGSSAIVKHIFFRLIGVCKRPGIRKAMEIEHRLLPYRVESLPDKECLNMILDMMRTTWGDNAKYPPAPCSPWTKSFVMPSGPRVRELCETLVHYLTAQTARTNTKLVKHLQARTYMSLMKELAASRKTGFVIPVRLTNWMNAAATQAFSDMATAHLGRGDLGRAERTYLRAKRMREITYKDVRGAGHPGFATDCLHLVHLYHALGRWSEADENLQRALEIVEYLEANDLKANMQNLKTIKSFAMGGWKKLLEMKREAYRKAELQLQRKRKALCARVYQAWKKFHLGELHARLDWVAAKRHRRYYQYWSGLRGFHRFYTKRQHYRKLKATADYHFHHILKRKAVGSWRLAMPMLVAERCMLARVDEYYPFRLRFFMFGRWFKYLQTMRRLRWAVSHWRSSMKSKFFALWFKFHAGFRYATKIQGAFRGHAHRRWLHSYREMAVEDFSREGIIFRRILRLSRGASGKPELCNITVHQNRTDFFVSAYTAEHGSVHKTKISFGTTISLIKNHPAFRQHMLTKQWLLERLISMLVLLPSGMLQLVDAWTARQQQLLFVATVRHASRCFVANLLHSRLPHVARKVTTLKLMNGFVQQLQKFPSAIPAKHRRTSLSNAASSAIGQRWPIRVACWPAVCQQLVSKTKTFLYEYGVPLRGVKGLNNGNFKAQITFEEEEGEESSSAPSRMSFRHRKEPAKVATKHTVTRILGTTFASAEEAARAYDTAALEIFGPSAETNYAVKHLPDGIQMPVLQLMSNSFVVHRRMMEVVLDIGEERVAQSNADSAEGQNSNDDDLETEAEAEKAGGEGAGGDPATTGQDGVDALGDGVDALGNVPESGDDTQDPTDANADSEAGMRDAMVLKKNAVRKHAISKLHHKGVEIPLEPNEYKVRVRIFGKMREAEIIIRHPEPPREVADLASGSAQAKASAEVERAEHAARVVQDMWRRKQAGDYLSKLKEAQMATVKKELEDKAMQEEEEKLFAGMSFQEKAKAKKDIELIKKQADVVARKAGRKKDRLKSKIAKEATQQAEKEQREKELRLSHEHQKLLHWSKAKKGELHTIESKRQQRLKNQLDKKAQTLLKAERKANRAEYFEQKQHEHMLALEEAQAKTLMARNLRRQRKEDLARQLREAKIDHCHYTVKLIGAPLQLVSAIRSTGEKYAIHNRINLTKVLVHRVGMRISGRHCMFTIWRHCSQLPRPLKATSSKEADRMRHALTNYYFVVVCHNVQAQSSKQCILFEEDLAPFIALQHIETHVLRALQGRLLSSFHFEAAKMRPSDHEKLGALFAVILSSGHGLMLAKLTQRSAAGVDSVDVKTSRAAHRFSVEFVNTVLKMEVMRTVMRKVTVPALNKALTPAQRQAASHLFEGFALGPAGTPPASKDGFTHYRAHQTGDCQVGLRRRRNRNKANAPKIKFVNKRGRRVRLWARSKQSAPPASIEQAQPEDELVETPLEVIGRLQQSSGNSMTRVKYELREHSDVVQDPEIVSFCLRGKRAARRPYTDGERTIDPNIVISNSHYLSGEQCDFEVQSFKHVINVRFYNRASHAVYTCALFKDEIACLLRTRHCSVEWWFIIHDRLLYTLGLDTEKMSRCDRKVMGQVIAAVCISMENDRTEFGTGIYAGLQVAFQWLHTELRAPIARSMAVEFVYQILKWKKRPVLTYQKGCSRLMDPRNVWISTIDDEPTNVDFIARDDETARRVPGAVKLKIRLPGDYFEVEEIQKTVDQQASDAAEVQELERRVLSAMNEMKGEIKARIAGIGICIQDNAKCIKLLYDEALDCRTMQDIVYERKKLDDGAVNSSPVWKPKFIATNSVRASWNPDTREPVPHNRTESKDLGKLKWIEAPVVKYRLEACRMLLKTQEQLLAKYMEVKRELAVKLEQLERRIEFFSALVRSLAARRKAVFACYSEAKAVLKKLHNRRWNFEMLRLGAACVRIPWREQQFIHKIRQVWHLLVGHVNKQQVLQKRMQVVFQAETMCFALEAQHLTKASAQFEEEMSTLIHNCNLLQKQVKYQTRIAFNKRTELMRVFEACRIEELHEEHLRFEADAVEQREAEKRRRAEAEGRELERRKREAVALAQAHEAKTAKAAREAQIKKRWKEIQNLVKQCSDGVARATSSAFTEYKAALRHVSYKEDLMALRLKVKDLAAPAKANDGPGEKREIKEVSVSLLWLLLWLVVGGGCAGAGAGGSQNDIDSCVHSGYKQIGRYLSRCSSGIHEKGIDGTSDGSI
jgi:hypothetical protein